MQGAYGGLICILLYAAAGGISIGNVLLLTDNTPLLLTDGTDLLLAG
jgi:hypothetical protein